MRNKELGQAREILEHASGQLTQALSALKRLERVNRGNKSPRRTSGEDVELLEILQLLSFSFENTLHAKCHIQGTIQKRAGHPKPKNSKRQRQNGRRNELSD